jgi:hypothetical protein
LALASPGVGNIKQQAGAELCQAQAQVGLTAEADLILMLPSMDAIFYLFKKKSKNFQAIKVTFH